MGSSQKSNMPRPCGCGSRGRHKSSCPLNGNVKKQCLEPRVPRLEQVEQRMSLIDKAINNVTEEFLCPITRELLVDPVIATDGILYEKGAILKWFSCENTSPCTRKNISKCLIPAISVKNSIKILVEAGVVHGNVSTVWKRNMKNHEFIKGLREKIENNDLTSLAYLAKFYECGLFGLPRDVDEATLLYNQGIQLGDPRSMVWHARLMLETNGSSILTTFHLTKALHHTALQERCIAAVSLCEFFNCIKIPHGPFVPDFNVEVNTLLAEATKILDELPGVDGWVLDDVTQDLSTLKIIMKQLYEGMDVLEELNVLHKETLENLFLSGFFPKYENWWMRFRTAELKKKLEEDQVCIFFEE